MTFIIGESHEVLVHDEVVLQACKVVFYPCLHKHCTTTLTPDVNISAGYQVDRKRML
jgi:hypothetical protein